MGTHKNFYQTLGLLPQADDVVIKAAYKALAQKHHPDKNKINKELNTQIMAELNAAYEVIGTKSKRKAYDESLKRAYEVRAKKSKPPVTSHSELIEKLEKSSVDELVVVTLYEEHFLTSVTINSGWVNTYSIQQGNSKVTLGFTELKARIIQKLKQK